MGRGRDAVGVSGPWGELALSFGRRRSGAEADLSRYIKFLAPVDLPTTWTEEEQALLAGTSLEVRMRRPEAVHGDS